MDAKQNRFQQQVIKQQASRQDAIRFFNLLTSAELFDVLESFLPEHRERLFLRGLGSSLALCLSKG